VRPLAALLATEVMPEFSACWLYPAKKFCTINGVRIGVP
jgi:hypothetical protein